MKAEIYDQQEIVKRRKPRGVEDIKSDFWKKFNLAANLVNETVYKLASPSVPRKV